MDMRVNLLQRQLAIASRYLSLEGHDDFNQGQISGRIKGDSSHIYIKKAVCGFGYAEPGDIIECSAERGSLQPKDAPPELPLHQAIYVARPDVNAIVHTHSEAAIVFAALGLTLRPISHDACYFLDSLSYFNETTQTILTDEIAARVAVAMGNNNAIFLQNHGMVIVASSVRKAAVLAAVLDRACRIQIAAESVSKEYASSPIREVPVKRDYIYSDVAIKTYWDHVQRVVNQKWPETSKWT